MQAPTLPSTAGIFNDITVKGFWLTKWFERASAEDKQKTFAEIIGLISSGLLKAKVSRTYGLDDIKEAVQAAVSGGRDGKILLVPNPL